MWYANVTTVPTRYRALPARTYGVDASGCGRTDITTSATHTAAVPSHGTTNQGVGAASLISCMAIRPCRSGRRSSAVITNVEKAKNTPAARPDPTVATTVRARPYRPLIAAPP